MPQEFGSRTGADEVVRGHDLSGRTIIVTGANTGIGEPAARVLAGAGASVVYACRDAAKGQAAVDRARREHPGCDARFVPLDLASFASIGAFCDALGEGPVHALICNAGLAAMRYETTEEGFERTVGVCHIGHFLLARRLAGRLLAAGTPRVVMVSSHSHRTPAKLDFDRLPMPRQGYRGMVAYGQAKLCNVLMANALQRRYGAQGLMACSLHPGTLVTTEIGRGSALIGGLMKLISPFTKTPMQGAATTVWATVHEPASDLAAQYLDHCRIARMTAEAADPAVADRLWTRSEEWVAQAGAPEWP